MLTDWPEYADARLESLKPQTLLQVEALKKLRADPAGSYFLHGRYGSGKTHIMVAQYCELALRGDRCLIRSSKQLMDELRKAEMQPPPGEEPFVSPVLQGVNLATSFHLCWDDVEKAPARSDFRAEAVFDLLDTIWRRQLGITVTSNLPLEGLTQVFGNAATARLQRICTVIAL